MENAGGASNKLKLYGDNVNHLAEVEPNNSSDSPQIIATPATVWGSLASAGDADSFRITGKAGQTIVAELSSKTIGSKANAELELFDPSGRLLSANNDFDGSSDPLVAYTLPADGEYTLRVSELMLMGGLGFHYRLTVGELPFVVGVYPLSVPAKQESQVELVGYNIPPGAMATVKAGDGGEAAVAIDANRFRTRRGLSVVVSSLPESLEAEPNDAPGKATSVSIPISVNGRIANANDADVYRFEATQGPATADRDQRAPAWFAGRYADRSAFRRRQTDRASPAPGGPRLLHQLPVDHQHADGCATEELGGDGA